MSIKKKTPDGMTRRELLVKPVSAGLFGFAFFSLFRQPLRAADNNLFVEAVPGDLPPIIIKSGSFTIESDEPLAESGGGPYNYRRNGFKLIQAVRVIKFNEHTGTTQTYQFADALGIELDIRLQNYVSGAWQPLDQSSIAQIKNETVQGATNFVLTIAKDLDKKGKSKPRRKEKREDKGSEVFRFGSIVIRGKGAVAPPVIPPTVEGDEYVIGLYNYTVPDSRTQTS